jgi:hypothetical protein
MAELLRYTQHLHTSHSLPIVDKSERVKLDVSSGDNVRSTVGVNHAQLTLLDFMKLTRDSIRELSQKACKGNLQTGAPGICRPC